MAISSGPNRPADGLVFAIDTGNIKSFSGLGTSARNIVGSGLSSYGAIVNGPSYIGQWFGSLSFDNDNDYIVISNDAILQSNSGTLYAWIKTRVNDSQVKCIVGKNSAYGIYLRNATPFVIDFSTGIEYISDEEIADDEWHFLTLTYSSGTNNGSKLYVDGILKNTFTLTIANQNSDFYIGAKSLSGGIISNGLVLLLDANNSLSYPGSGNTWYDLSPYRRNAVLYNSPTFQNTSGNSLVFNGIDEYAEVSDWSKLTGNSNFTISTVVKFQNSTNQMYFSYGTGTSSSAVQLGIGSSSFGFFANNNQTSLEYSYLMSDSWNHITFSHNGSISKLYVNGAFVKPKITSYNVGSSNLYIGKSGFASSFSDAKVASIAVYNRTLTDAEIVQNYNNIKNFYVNTTSERTLGTLADPAPSGLALKINYPDLPSGYYYIKSSIMPNPLLMYVDMTNDGGGFDYYRITGGTSINFITQTHSGIALGLDLIYPRSQGHWKSMYEFANGVLGVSLNSVMAICGAVTRNTQLNGSGNYTSVIMRDPNNYASGALDWKVPDGGRWWLRDLFYGEPNGDYSYDAFLSFSGVSPDGSNLTYNDGYSSAYTGTSYLVSTNAKP